MQMPSNFFTNLDHNVLSNIFTFIFNLTVNCSMCQISSLHYPVRLDVLACLTAGFAYSEDVKLV